MLTAVLERPSLKAPPTISIRDYLFNLMNTAGHAWFADWYLGSPQSVIIRKTSTNGQGAVDLKTFDIPMTDDIIRIGWSGLAADGMASWVGWDFDIGHGAKSYPDQFEALADACKLWDMLQYKAEIRASTGGIGLHVRHRLDTVLNNHDAVLFVKGIAASLKLKVDPTPLGRQAFWFWERNHQCGAFRQILRSKGGHWDA